MTNLSDTLKRLETCDGDPDVIKECAAEIFMAGVVSVLSRTDLVGRVCAAASGVQRDEVVFVPDLRVGT